MIRPALIALALLAAPAARADDGTVREVVKSYAISGSTGRELYDSIGRSGPLIRGGKTRTIAHTDYDLRWRRDYRKQGNACVLAAATPILTITTTLPKPKGKLPQATQAKWQTFITGIAAHEAVHAQLMRELMQTIRATTVGLTVDNDPKCIKIREAIQTPLRAAVADYRAKTREFEEAEMRQGGNVWGLVVGLVLL